MPWKAVLMAATIGILLWGERRRPLRRRVESAPRRLARNAVVAAVAAVTVSVAERPVTRRLAQWIERRPVGVLRLMRLPPSLETLAALVLLDYTLYVWHVLIHRVPVLWRLHVVHHVDLDLDVSTAFRFHAAELLVSVLWRAGQIVMIGVRPHALALWQTLTLLSVLFHHSSVRLPLSLERRLVWLIVTPRMHGIHHSIVPDETHANWSSGLTLWDWLHGTLILSIPQDAVTIGVPAYRAPEDVALGDVLALPFMPQRPTWRCPDGGTPVRPSQSRVHEQPAMALAP